METWLTQILSSANGRHFRDDELIRIMMYGQSLPARLQACKEIHEQRDFLSRQLLKTHADIVGNSAFAGDLVDSLLPIAQSMLLDDLFVVETKLNDRFYTLVVLMGMETETIEELFVYLEQTLSTRVSSSTKDLMGPYFSWSRERITQLMEEQKTVLV